MAKIYYDRDANLGLLKGKTVGIIGFGSQGHAHAQNLKDSGCQVMVAEAQGTEGWKAARAAGFKVTNAEVRLAGYCPDCQRRLFGNRNKPK